MDMKPSCLLFAQDGWAGLKLSRELALPGRGGGEEPCIWKAQIKDESGSKVTSDTLVWTQSAPALWDSKDGTPFGTPYHLLANEGISGK